LATLDAVGRRCLQAKLQGLGVAAELSLARYRRKDGLVIGQAVTDQTALRDVLMLGLEEREVLGLVDAVLVVIELEADDVATLLRNLGTQQIGLDDDCFGSFTPGTAAVTGATGSGACRLEVGCGVGVSAVLTVVEATAFGWLYFCQASQSMTSENEKMRRRSRRRLSMKTYTI
jgi:hypothetical protein